MKLRSKSFQCLALIVLLVCLNACRQTPLPKSEGNPMPVDEKRLEGLVAAPEFPEYLQWLNTDKPVSIRSLRGKLVLLDFWTFCCINCMHVIPDLKKLEKKYPNELVVIGVHSAKFVNEKSTDSIRQAILRYGIEHPVVNDKDLEVWNTYAVSSWPTLVLINPNGRIIGVNSGEGAFEVFDPVIAQSVKYFDQKKLLNRRGGFQTRPYKGEEAKKANTLLSFPGKISADTIKKQIFITDSNHHRILIADPGGKILDVIGTGKQGTADGSFETVEFNHPQGTFTEGNTLYIADTENHLIRKADLASRKVETILGTGAQNRGSNFQGTRTDVALNSPWDLLIQDGKLFIAMAGAHQLYVADLKTFEIKPFAGSGREARLDGPLLAAALAQPSGLTTDGKKIYFADSETSSIRSADMDPKGKVETIVGEDLFEFGDRDGSSRVARLQHPLGLIYQNQMLYVADTYNSKIKRVDPFKHTSQTFAGTGAHGYKDGKIKEAQFFEPGGISFLDGKFYVADTNNHQIRVLDLQTEEVKTLEFKGLEKLSRQTGKAFKGRVIDLPPQNLKSGLSSIRLSVKLPDGYKFTANAPSFVVLKSGPENVIQPSPAQQEVKQFPAEVRVRANLGKTDVTLDTVIYFCRKDSTVCVFDQVRVHAPIEVKEDGPSLLNLTVEAKAKER